MQGIEKTSFGLDVDLACVLCYAAGPLSGVPILLLEKKDVLVRFHALQSSLLFLPFVLFMPIFFLVPVSDAPGLRFLLYTAGGLVCIATVGVLAWIVPCAWRMERKRVPILGKLVDRWIPDEGDAEEMKAAD